MYDQRKRVDGNRAQATKVGYVCNVGDCLVVRTWSKDCGSSHLSILCFNVYRQVESLGQNTCRIRRLRLRKCRCKVNVLLGEDDVSSGRCSTVGHGHSFLHSCIHLLSPSWAKALHRPYDNTRGQSPNSQYSEQPAITNCGNKRSSHDTAHAGEDVPHQIVDSHAR